TSLCHHRSKLPSVEMVARDELRHQLHMRTSLYPHTLQFCTSLRPFPISSLIIELPFAKESCQVMLIGVVRNEVPLLNRILKVTPNGDFLNHLSPSFSLIRKIIRVGRSNLNNTNHDTRRQRWICNIADAVESL